jgi:trehalose-phosphatase
MNPQAAGILDALLRAYGQGLQLLLLFDYDGTLTPLAAHPRLAKLPRAMRNVLKRLADKPRVAVGILSGRALEDLKAMVGLEGLYYAGTVGMELDLRGHRVAHPQSEQMARLMARIAGLLNTVVQDYPGAWLENKELGLTVHYRQTNPGQRAELKSRTVEILKGDAGLLHLEEGPLAVEITPKHGWNKADAVQGILASLDAAKIFPLYVGDTANDLSALQAVRRRGGIGVWIGSHPPAVAASNLADPGQLLDLLVRLNRKLPHARRPRADRRSQAPASCGSEMDQSPRISK